MIFQSTRWTDLRQPWFLLLIFVVGFLCTTSNWRDIHPSSQQQPKVFRYAFPPRVLVLESDYTRRGHSWKPITLLLEESGMETDFDPDRRDRSSSSTGAVMDDKESGCPFVADYQSQTSAKPNCNQLHEVGIRLGDYGLMHRLEHLDSGGFKDVWRVFAEDNTPTDFVLKTTLYKRGYRENDLTRHLKDALVMEETTSSKYVLNMYGYCAHSNLVESAWGTLNSWLSANREKANPLELLEVAVMVARGVADMQVYRDGMPTFAHADVKASQFLKLTNMGDRLLFKINDFNRGRLLTSKNPPEICPFIIRGKHKGSTCRAPEEYHDRANLNDKIDVFSLGSVLFFILTGETPFQEVEKYKDAITQITSGVEPRLPKDIRESTDPSIVALVETMRKCRQMRPGDRPTSQEAATLLAEALSRILKKQGS